MMGARRQMQAGYARCLRAATFTAIDSRMRCVCIRLGQVIKLLLIRLAQELEIFACGHVPPNSDARRGRTLVGSCGPGSRPGSKTLPAGESPGRYIVNPSSPRC